MSEGNTLVGADDTERVVVEVPAHLKRQFKDSVDSMSGALRQFMRQSVTLDNEELATPTDDDDLAKAYQILVRNKNQKTGNIQIRRAKSLVSQQTGISEDDLMAFVFGPLERRGYVSMRYGAPGKGGTHKGSAQGVISVREHYTGGDQ